MIRNTISRWVTGVVALPAVLIAGAAQADTVTINGFDDPIPGGSTRNQGFYIDQGANPGAHSTNNSYIIGKFAGTLYHSYFSFSLGDLGAAQTVVGAKLELTRAQTNEANEATEFFGLFDVLTDAVTLNTGPYSQAVFEDLGMGVSYGVFGIDTTSGDPSDTLSFMLNDNAVEAINTAALAGEDYFSMGGAHQSVQQSAFFDRLFSTSGGGVSRLVLTTEPVPLPGTIVLLAPALLGMVATVRRRRGMIPMAMR